MEPYCGRVYEVTKPRGMPVFGVFGPATDERRV